MIWTLHCRAYQQVLRSHGYTLTHAEFHNHWVRDGLAALKAVIREKGVKSIAMPPLGCGNGGLDWAVVRPLIETELSDLRDVEVLVFEPMTKLHMHKAGKVE